MKTAIADDDGDPEPYDWVDDAGLSLSATWARFEQLRPVAVTTGSTSTTLTLTVE